MSDAALNEAVARAMGLEVRRWSDCPVGWIDLKPGQLLRAHPDAGGCLIDHKGDEWDILADDYSGVPAMEAWCRERGWSIDHEVTVDHAVELIQAATGWLTASTYPRALALAIVAAVEAGR